MIILAWVSPPVHAEPPWNSVPVLFWDAAFIPSHKYTCHVDIISFQDDGTTGWHYKGPRFVWLWKVLNLKERLIGGKYEEVMKETICFKPKHHFLKENFCRLYFLVVE